MVSDEESIEGIRNGAKQLRGQLADRLRVIGKQRWSDPGGRRESTGYAEGVRLMRTRVQANRRDGREKECLPFFSLQHLTSVLLFITGFL